MTQAYVCLGSNMGDAEKYLALARELLASQPGVHLAAVSSIYRTEPQGRKDQPWFLNQVLRLDCEEGVSAHGLLRFMLKKELEMGRVRDVNDHFGPRVIDMDLLLFGSEVWNDAPELIVPHPRMTERAFVLVPLAEIAPDVHLPGGPAIKTFLEKLDYRLDGLDIFQ